jgi:branched-chain amino acid transport system ATP-binding protein
MTAPPLLRAEGLEAAYGSSQVLFGIDLELRSGEVATLLGRNGMGKTTTVRALLGLTPARSGAITFRGERIESRRPDQIARMGVALVPEGRQIFPNLTVRENLQAFGENRSRATHPWTLERVLALFPALASRARQMGNQLSGGEQQMLAIGRALMQNPELLLLDEPIEGLAPLVVKHLGEALRQFRDAGVTILLADQNVKFCRNVADRGYILEKGLIQFEGTLAAIWENEAVLRKYLAV